jgi:hypothetical protein
MHTYLSDDQIDRMAEAAVTSYEFSCNWNKALEAAVEYSLDEFGIRPRKSAALLALKLAKTKWQGQVMAVQNAIANQ